MGDADSPTGPPPIANPDSQRELLNTIDKRLTSEDQALLNATISGAELTDALKQMKANSAPGMVGLTAVFNRVAAEDFKKCLSTFFNYQLSCGKLFSSQRKSAVCMLHKKGSRDDPGNFRPI
ncbi:uncharacterized protein PHALS_03731 [Plasmopara halstedii]|uniref:Uncharacterized protein n=1 Tax=Plasmopara halstedii TaxID=4781 RepID=A0A0P1B0P2_PLAHL|nr:uncharacterized protein PHALS_03731 [Plasmopara halstedii]CEG47070.1 hypothetical protein PHALS_03731 [Plasmopara halstedii]|eukprot:XP_024583439.1 hypothetical protein PHALS_03731 [Plasmopara halstedii]